MKQIIRNVKHNMINKYLWTVINFIITVAILCIILPAGKALSQTTDAAIITEYKAKNEAVINAIDGANFCRKKLIDFMDKHEVDNSVNSLSFMLAGQKVYMEFIDEKFIPPIKALMRYAVNYHAELRRNGINPEIVIANTKKTLKELTKRRDDTKDIHTLLLKNINHIVPTLNK